MSAKTTWRFDALDTWFFRESRPHSAAGGSQLNSLFPPPVRTIAGAMRTLIGEANNVDWQNFAAEAGNPTRQLIGFGDDMGPIKLCGPWLCHNGRRLYPVPAFLLAKTVGENTHYVRLKIGQATPCDIGNVCLPVLDENAAGAKPLENCWLTTQGLNAVLRGELPNSRDIIEQQQLFNTESRLGIARNNKQRTAIDGQLYQTVHVRPKESLSIEIDASGIDQQNLPASNHLIRLGGEGRLAAINIIAPAGKPLSPIKANSHQLILLLLTAATIDNRYGMPDGFKPSHANGTSTPDNTLTWSGKINSVSLTIHAAVVGKAQREGGWDLAAQRPREVHSLIPAGSAWYCTLDKGADIDTAISKLHGAQIGKENALGRGQLAVGLWPQHEFNAAQQGASS